MLKLGLNLGLGLGGRGGRRSKQAVFTWAGSDSGTKRINFNADVKIKVTGTISLGIDGKTIKAASGWVTVSPTASEYYTFTCSGTGDIVFSDARKVSYLMLYTLGSSVITGNITGMALTYLSLSNIGSSVITGNITGMALTYLMLFSIGSSVITGNVANSITQNIRILNIPSIQRPTWSANFTIISLTGAYGIAVTGSATKLSATESEGLLHAGWDLAVNTKTWNAAELNISTSADPANPPDYAACLPYLQAIVNYGKTVAVPDAWGWVIPEPEGE